MGQQMALAILYESGMPSMADYSNAYLNNPRIIDFYKAIPSARDETLYLDGELDGYYCAAVRAGDDWFVAGANSIVENTVTVDFSFLGEGTFEVELFNDDGNGSVTRRKFEVTADNSETVTMIANGGFAMRIQKKA